MRIRSLSAATGAVVLLAAASAALGATWATPVAVMSGASVSSGTNKTVVDTAGNATTVWYGSLGCCIKVQAARFSGGSWGAPVSLSPDGADAVTPDVAVDSTGTVTAIWRRAAGGGGVITASRYSGGAWSAPVDVSGSGRVAGNPKLAVDATGVVTAVWERNDGMYSRVESSRFSSGSWSTPEQISPSGGGATSPRVAVDATGTVTATWIRFDGASDRVQAARYSGSWGTVTTFPAAGAVLDSNPTVTAGPSGAATVMWKRYSYGVNTYSVVASRFESGAWNTVTDVTAGLSNANPPLDISSVTDSSGNVTATWANWDVGTSRIREAAARFTGGSWGAPTFLTSAPTINAGATGLAVDSTGVVTAAWSRSDGTNDRIEAARFASGSWGSPTILSAGGQNARLPSLAVDGSGAVVATWSVVQVCIMGCVYNGVSASRYADAAPATPATPTAVAGSSQATVTVAQGPGAGDAPTSYLVTSSPDSHTCTVSGASGSCDVIGLTNGTSYTFTATATNSGGTSASSSASSAVIPMTAASAPTNLVATAHDQSVEVAFTPGANGGSPISNYQYRLNGSGSWTAFSPSQTTSPVTISGLTNGTAYTVELRAVTGYASPGTASSATAGVTPAGPVVAPTPTPDPTAGGTSAESQASQLSGAPVVMGPARTLAMHAPHRTAQGLMVSTGHVPEGATAIVQIARTGVSSLSLDAWAHARVMTKCPITGQGTSRVFACSMRLGAGTWVITTQARDGATILASSAKRVVVRATTRTAVTG